MGPLDSLASQFSLYCDAQHYKRFWHNKARWRTPEETQPKLIHLSTRACSILDIPSFSGLPQDGNGLAKKSSCAILLFLLELYVNSQQSLLKALSRRYQLFGTWICWLCDSAGVLDTKIQILIIWKIYVYVECPWEKEIPMAIDVEWSYERIVNRGWMW